jgi:acetone carboxylase gamma subunit
MIILQEKKTLFKEGWSKFEKEIMSSAKIEVMNTLKKIHDRNINSAGSMWPGKERFFIAECIGAIQALTASIADIPSTPAIDDLEKHLNSFYKQILSYESKI